MSGITGTANFGASALHALQQLNARTSSLVDQISNPDALSDTADFAKAIVEMNALKIQTKATFAVLHTTDSLAQELLSRPRR